MGKLKYDSTPITRSNSFVLFYNKKSSIEKFPNSDLQLETCIITVPSVICKKKESPKTVFDIIPSLKRDTLKRSHKIIDGNLSLKRIPVLKLEKKRGAASSRKKLKAPSTITRIIRKMNPYKSIAALRAEKQPHRPRICKSSISNPIPIISETPSGSSLKDITITNNIDSSEHIYEELLPLDDIPPLSHIHHREYDVSAVPNTNPLIRRSNLMHDRRLGGEPNASSTLDTIDISSNPDVLGATCNLIRTPGFDSQIIHSNVVRHVSPNIQGSFQTPIKSPVTIRSRIITSPNIQFRSPNQFNQLNSNSRTISPFLRFRYPMNLSGEKLGSATQLEVKPLANQREETSYTCPVTTLSAAINEPTMNYQNGRFNLVPCKHVSKVTGIVSPQTYPEYRRTCTNDVLNRNSNLQIRSKSISQNKFQSTNTHLQSIVPLSSTSDFSSAIEVSNIPINSYAHSSHSEQSKVPVTRLQLNIPSSDSQCSDIALGNSDSGFQSTYIRDASAIDSVHKSNSSANSDKIVIPTSSSNTSIVKSLYELRDDDCKSSIQPFTSLDIDFSTSSTSSSAQNCETASFPNSLTSEKYKYLRSASNIKSPLNSCVSNLPPIISSKKSSGLKLPHKITTATAFPQVKCPQQISKFPIKATATKPVPISSDHNNPLTSDRAVASRRSFGSLLPTDGGNNNKPTNLPLSKMRSVSAMKAYNLKRPVDIIIKTKITRPCIPTNNSNSECATNSSVFNLPKYCLEEVSVINSCVPHVSVSNAISHSSQMTAISNKTKVTYSHDFKKSLTYSNETNVTNSPNSKPTTALHGGSNKTGYPEYYLPVSSAFKQPTSSNSKIKNSYMGCSSSSSVNENIRSIPNSCISISSTSTTKTSNSNCNLSESSASISTSVASRRLNYPIICHKDSKSTNSSARNLLARSKLNSKVPNSSSLKKIKGICRVATVTIPNDSKITKERTSLTSSTNQYKLKSDLSTTTISDSSTNNNQYLKSPIAYSSCSKITTKVDGCRLSNVPVTCGGAKNSFKPTGLRLPKTKISGIGSVSTVALSINSKLQNSTGSGTNTTTNKHNLRLPTVKASSKTDCSNPPSLLSVGNVSTATNDRHLEPHMTCSSGSKTKTIEIDDFRAKNSFKPTGLRLPEIRNMELKVSKSQCLDQSITPNKIKTIDVHLGNSAISSAIVTSHTDSGTVPIISNNETKLPSIKPATSICGLIKPKVRQNLTKRTYSPICNKRTSCKNVSIASELPPLNLPESNTNQIPKFNNTANIVSSKIAIGNANKIIPRYSQSIPVIKSMKNNAAINQTRKSAFSYNEVQVKTPSLNAISKPGHKNSLNSVPHKISSSSQLERDETKSFPANDALARTKPQLGRAKNRGSGLKFPTKTNFPAGNALRQSQTSKQLVGEQVNDGCNYLPQVEQISPGKFSKITIDVEEGHSCSQNIDKNLIVCHDDINQDIRSVRDKICQNNDIAQKIRDTNNKEGAKKKVDGKKYVSKLAVPVRVRS